MRSFYSAWREHKLIPAPRELQALLCLQPLFPQPFLSCTCKSVLSQMRGDTSADLGCVFSFPSLGLWPVNFYISHEVMGPVSHKQLKHRVKEQAVWSRSESRWFVSTWARCHPPSHLWVFRVKAAPARGTHSSILQPCDTYWKMG